MEVLGPGPRHGETSARGTEHFKNVCKQRRFLHKLSCISNVAENRGRKTAGMPISSTGEVDKLQRVLHQQAPRGTPALSNIQEDLSPSEVR